MTPRKICEVVNHDRVRITRRDVGTRHAMIATMRPSAILGGTRHVAVVHGRLGALGYTGNARFTCSVSVDQDDPRGAPTSRAFTHSLTFDSRLDANPIDSRIRQDGSVGAPNVGLPFYVVLDHRDVTSTVSGFPASISVYATLTNETADAGVLTAFDVENLTITVYDLDALDASDVRYTIDSASSLVAPVTVGAADFVVAQGSAAPRLTGADDEYALFWSTEVGTRERPPSGELQQFVASAALISPAGSLQATHGGRGYGRRANSSSTVATLHQVGGAWVRAPGSAQRWAVALREVDQAGTGTTTSRRWALFSLELRNLNPAFHQVGAENDRYGAPFETGRDRAQTLRASYVSDQQRDRVAITDAVPLQVGFPIERTLMSFGSQIQYVFTNASGFGSNFEPRLYVLQADRDERTWDCETTRIVAVRGANVVELLGQWNPNDYDLAAPTPAVPAPPRSYRVDEAGAPDLQGVHAAMICTFDQVTGIDPYVEPNPQFGPDVYVVPGAPSPNVSALPSLPVEPVRSTETDYRDSFGTLRTIDGESYRWPLWLKPVMVVTHEFFCDCTEESGRADLAALENLVARGVAAFRYRDPNTETDHAHVLDVSQFSVNQSDQNLPIYDVSMRSFRLSWTDAP